MRVIRSSFRLMPSKFVLEGAKFILNTVIHTFIMRFPSDLRCAIASRSLSVVYWAVLPVSAWERSSGSSPLLFRSQQATTWPMWPYSNWQFDQLQRYEIAFAELAPSTN